MFSFNPELAAADDMEDGDEAVVSYARSDDENEENENMYRELNLDLISLEASEVKYIILIYNFKIFLIQLLYESSRDEILVRGVDCLVTSESSWLFNLRLKIGKNE